MATSQNGYSANDRSVIGSFTVPGSTRRVSLRKGDTSVILLDLAGWMDAHIVPIDIGIYDDWGYAERTIRGSSTTLSNHASGTALDYDAVQHPLGVRNTWTADQKRRINERLALYDGCIRWGENYTGRPDGMHFEIDRGAAACRVVADRIRAGRLGGGPAPSQPAKKKGLPEMIERALIQGLNVGRIVCPTGSASGLVSQAWASVSCQGGARVQLWCQRGARSDGPPPGVAKGVVDWTLLNAERPYMEIPSGTEYLEYRITADGPGSLLVEQRPK